MCDAVCPIHVIIAPSIQSLKLCTPCSSDPFLGNQLNTGWIIGRAPTPLRFNDNHNLHIDLARHLLLNDMIIRPSRWFGCESLKYASAPCFRHQPANKSNRSGWLQEFVLATHVPIPWRRNSQPSSFSHHLRSTAAYAKCTRKYMRFAMARTPPIWEAPTSIPQMGRKATAF